MNTTSKHLKMATTYVEKRKIANLETADELSKLAFKYESDRCPQIKHPFTPTYYELLKDKRNSIAKVLEIGVGYREMDYWRSYQTGAGLLMWRDFFSNAHIYGVDNDPRAMVKAHRISTFMCDQTNKESLTNVINIIGTDIDLVIDDGSHKTKDQIFSCLTVMPLVNESTIYIIEDVSEPEKILTALNMYDCLVPKLRRRFKDDNLVVVRNKK
jgi:hypothetical protein